MPDIASEVDRRIAQLERRTKRLYIGVLMLFGLLAFWLVAPALGVVPVIARYIDTREFNVPPPSQWSTVSVCGGLAPAVDGKSITLWLAGGPLTGDLRQTRLELEHGGSQEITMIDQKGKTRLRIASAADGTPSITLFGPDGKPVWTAPEPAVK